MHNQQIKEALQQKVDNKTKPLGALGKLEELAKKIGLIQNTLTPVLKKPTILVFAADHGISESGVSPYPKDVTWQMVANFLSGGAAINVFCQQHNIELKIVDAGVDHDFDENNALINAKIARGTQNVLNEPAMSSDQCTSAIEKGKALVQAEYDNGCNIIGFGEMGIGNTSSAALLMSRYCDLPIESCVGKGTGLDDQGMSKKTQLLKDALNKYPEIKDPPEILATFGGFEIAMMAGAMMQAQQNNMIIMIDGFISTAALLAAHAINAKVLGNCIFCHQSDEKGHVAMLKFLNARPLIDLGMRLGEGTGVAVAFPIIQSAVNFLNDMASFEAAGVSNRS